MGRMSLKRFGVLILLGTALTACGKFPALWATPTPLPSATRAPTLTATRTLTPAPTATPLPPVKIESADVALFAGDWALAQADYQRVIEQNADGETLAAAHLGVGRARLYAGDAPGAMEAFAFVTETFPQSSAAANAYFLLGEAQMQLGAWAEAIAAYQTYLQLRPALIDSYVQERIARAALTSGDYNAAVTALKAALAAARVGDGFDLQEQLAQAYITLGESEAALAEYAAFESATDANWRKARAT